MAEVPKKMKALLKAKAQTSYEYAEVDVPEPKEGEILVKMEWVAICGSDIPLYKVSLFSLSLLFFYPLHLLILFSITYIALRT